MSGDSLPNGLVCACDEASANEHNVTRSNAHGVFFMAVPLEGVALHDLFQGKILENSFSSSSNRRCDWKKFNPSYRGESWRIPVT